MTFRNLLAGGISLGIFPLLWILQGKGLIALPDSIIGMTIALETLVFNFYFRKAGPGK